MANLYSSLNDGDDDVKSVAASCLLPVAEHIVQQLPESLDQILVVLWQCLSNMKDDLSSSVGVVMDLLGERWLIFLGNF
jgi:TATA-binding protein-associated factor